MALPAERIRPARRLPALALPLALAALPPLVVVAMILRWTVDVPFADQWALAPLLEKSYRGTLTFADLWAQHNEHRLLFPRLLMLALARLSGWNTHWEMLGNVVLAGGIMAVLAAQARATARAAGLAWAWLLPPLSLLVFSLNQAENWWGGWNLQIFMNVLAAVAALVLLARPDPRWPYVALAAACGFVASLSYSNGLLLWPLGALLLLLRPRRFTPGALAKLAAWLLAGGLTLAAFFAGYVPTAQAPAPADILANAGRYLTYAVTYLGAPPTRGAVEYVFGVVTGDTRAVCDLGDSGLCAQVNDTAIIAGIAGLLAVALLLWWLARRLSFAALLPYLGLALYAAGTGLFTSLGRASLGNHQALAQRYATTAVLLWAVLLILAFFGWQVATRPGARRLCLGAVLALALLLAICTLQGPDHFRRQYDFLLPARAELLTLRDDALLARLFPDPAVVRADAGMLREHRLTVYR